MYRVVGRRLLRQDRVVILGKLVNYLLVNILEVLLVCAYTVISLVFKLRLGLGPEPAGYL